MVNRILALFALLAATATAAATTVTALAFGTRVLVFPATTFGVAAALSSSSVPFTIKNNNHQKNTFSTVLSLSSHRHRHHHQQQQQQQQQQIKTQLYRIRGGSSSSSSVLNLSPAFIRMAETLAPKIGVITSTALYLAPAVAVMKAIQSNDRGDLNPIPLAVMSTSSLAWLVYGIIVQDPYVTLSNIGGTIASMGYIVGLLPLLASASSSSSSSQDQNHNNNTNLVLLRQTQYVLMAGVSMSLLLWTYLGLTVMGVAPPFVLSIKEVGSVLGIFASILFILLSASPLSTIRTVITTKSSKSILGPFMIAQCLNTSLWTMYGLAIKNKFVWGPNSVGLGLGLVQLALKLAFP